MVRNRTPKIQRLSATRSQANIDRFLRLAEQVERGIDHELYYPNAGYTCGICGYKDMCGKWYRHLFVPIPNVSLPGSHCLAEREDDFLPHPFAELLAGATQRWRREIPAAVRELPSPA